MVQTLETKARRSESPVTTYQRKLILKRGFRSLTAYNKFLAKQNGYVDYQAMQQQWARDKRFKSLAEYKRFRKGKKKNESIENFRARKEREKEEKIAEQRRLEILVRRKDKRSQSAAQSATLIREELETEAIGYKTIYGYILAKRHGFPSAAEYRKAQKAHG